MEIITKQELNRLATANIKVVHFDNDDRNVPLDGTIFAYETLIQKNYFGSDYVGDATYVRYWGVIDGVTIINLSAKVGDWLLPFVFFGRLRRRRAFNKVIQALMD